MNKILACLFLLINGLSVFAQQADSTDYISGNYLRFYNFTYVSNIKTVILERAGEPMTDPVIRLNSGEKLELSFDDLQTESQDYSYRIIHCDSKWRPSVLSESDFTGGFYTDRIANYRPSFNSYTPYYHYTLQLPNENLQPIISGNYLLVVYKNEKPDLPVITRRFWVVESIVDIKTQIHGATDVQYRYTHQEVVLKINTGSLRIVNPYNDIKVNIMQNNCRETTIENLKPSIAINEILEYNYDDINIFQAGNEFRNADIRSVKFQNQSTEAIQQDSNHLYTVTLKPALSRAFLRYNTEEDINGRFLIKVYEGRDGNLEGDYVKVVFRLKTSNELEKGNLYIYGQLTNWEIIPQARMKYYPDERCYTDTLLLKQGYYNYCFMTIPDSTGKPEYAEYEGSHYETGNDYSIFVYWKDITFRYERLIGYKLVDSRYN